MSNEEKELQKRNEELILLLAKKSVDASHGNGPTKFQETHLVGLNYSKIVFPWFLRLKLFLYSILLKINLRNKDFFIGKIYGNRADFLENIESLKFAAKFGCRANAKQRNWCAQVFHYFKINGLDQAFLVWTKTINVRRREIHFGRWDIVAAFASAVPLIAIGLFMLCTLLCDCLPICSKLFELALYFFIFIIKYQFLKSHSIDAYKVGSHYFTANGWSFLPLEKIPNFK